MTHVLKSMNGKFVPAMSDKVLSLTEPAALHQQKEALMLVQRYCATQKPAHALPRCQPFQVWAHQVGTACAYNPSMLVSVAPARPLSACRSRHHLSVAAPLRRSLQVQARGGGAPCPAAPVLRYPG